MAQSQSNAADSGYVRTERRVVVGATVTRGTQPPTFARSTASNDEGYYQCGSLPPGDYEVSVEAPNYKNAVVPTYKLTVGARADLR